MQAEGPDVGSILTIWDDVSDRQVLKRAEYHKRVSGVQRDSASPVRSSIRELGSKGTSARWTKRYKTVETQIEGRGIRGERSGLLLYLFLKTSLTTSTRTGTDLL